MLFGTSPPLINPAGALAVYGCGITRPDSYVSPGTNTDGVLIDISEISGTERGVIAHYKATTTPNVSDGIEKAVHEVLVSGGVQGTDITCVSIGTTAFINAVLEADARRLSKVAVIRLCGPYTHQCPPFIDFPQRLKALIQGHIGYVDGGLESTRLRLGW